METLMADILKVRTERFSPYCHQVFSKLIPDKSIHMHLVEISPTMRVSREANIRNGDRTNDKSIGTIQSKNSCQVHPDSDTRCLLLTSSSMRFQYASYR